MTTSPAPSRDVDLKDAVAILKRRRAWIIGAPLALLVLAGLYASITRPAYTATAQVFVDPRERRPPKDDPLHDAVPGDGLLLVESQLKIITSDEVLLRVVEKARLESDPEFGRSGGLLRHALASLGLVARSDPRLTALRNLRLRTAAKRIDRSFVIDIMASADTPDRAMNLANDLAAAYIDEQARADARYNKRLSESVTAQLEKLRRTVTESETAVAAFKAENNLVKSRNGLVSEQQLDEANTQLTNAKTRLADAQARERLIDTVRNGSAGLDAIPEAIQSPTIVQLRARAADLARDEAQLAMLDGPLHPALRVVQAQKRELQATIQAELRRVAQAVHNTTVNEATNVQSLQKAFDRLSAQAQTNDRLLVPLRQLERTAEANRAIYENFLAKAKTAEQQQVIDKSNIRLITRATLPEQRSWPPTYLLLAVALLGGLALGVVAALAHEHLAAQKEEWPADANDPDRESGAHPSDDEPVSPSRGRTSLFIHLSDERPALSAPLEYAREWSRDGKTVLFIDADVARGAATRLLGLVRRPGLKHLLAERTRFEDAVRFHKRFGFDVLPAGVHARTATDESARRALERLFDFTAGFDHVVIDGGRIGAVPGRLDLYRFADEIVLLAPKWMDERDVRDAETAFRSKAPRIRVMMQPAQKEAA